MVNFEPYQELFLSSFANSRTSYPGAPAMPSLFAYPSRNWRTAANKDQLPALGLRLSTLMDRLKVKFGGDCFEEILPVVCAKQVDLGCVSWNKFLIYDALF